MLSSLWRNFSVFPARTAEKAMLPFTFGFVSSVLCSLNGDEIRLRLFIYKIRFVLHLGFFLWKSVFEPFLYVGASIVGFRSNLLFLGLPNFM